MHIALIAALLALALQGQEGAPNGWGGEIQDARGNPVAGARIELQGPNVDLAKTSDSKGHFQFDELVHQSYRVVVTVAGRQFTYARSLDLPSTGLSVLTVGNDDSLTIASAAASQASGGETLSSTAVAAIPLNKRDFSQLLLLAAGTMTDTNGSSNFTQQFAVNGQRGVEAVFAMDGADTSDPEMGGATLSNFNVDAVQEIQSLSGWMPADIGRGAAAFTNIVTRSGTEDMHGSLFEFVRNSAFDARNFFDRRSAINPERIPPFRRNEFGFTLGGPFGTLRKSGRPATTHFFIEYQGFRQILGTTQVLAVPTASERSGLDTTAFPGDTLYVNVDPTIAAILKRYPLPNYAQGPFGPRTYATSSKVSTDADQLSIRLDRQIGSRDRLFARFTGDDLSGPITNPDQTAIDPAFGITYTDHQRNAVLNWTRTVSPQTVAETSIGFTRTTPSFPTPDHTDPALIFTDGLYEAFNAPGGSVTSAVGNLFHLRHQVSWTLGNHAFKAGAEWRANRDTTYYGQAVNGQYTFGGGASYAPSFIRSASGTHNIDPGDQLPDTLSAFLSGSAFAYVVAVAPPGFPQGDQIGVAAISRYNLNLYAEDTWKISRGLTLDYGLRYELYWPITERADRTGGLRFLPGPTGSTAEYLINIQPPYRLQGNDWGPRVRLSWQPSSAHWSDSFWIRIGGAVTTIPPNIWQDNLLTGQGPYVDYPRLTSAPGTPLLYGTAITPQELPGVFTPDGANILASGSSKAVPPNTVWDIDRFEQGIAALTPSHQVSPLNVNGISQDFRNAYMATWSLSVERQFGSVSGSAAYVGTAGISLPAIDFPNAFPGADSGFARYTEFDSAGHTVGGFGTQMVTTNRSHSTYHALQTSAQGSLPGGGPQIQVSFTLSKSLDDTSTVIGGIAGSSLAGIAIAFPQNPFDTRSEKGPSSFDVERVLTATVIQDLHAERALFLRRLNAKLTRGWQLLSVSTLTSGTPFTVYSGVQQTGAGSIGSDRPDQVGKPDLSNSRTIREDYFGAGTNNAAFFFIPVGLPGGTGPNSGFFGSLGRNTFRGPAFHDFDFALIKDTILGSESQRHFVDVEFRAETFNLFNIVNFGLPANVVTGSGFGEISRTASNSRQIQFSLKAIF